MMGARVDSKDDRAGPGVCGASRIVGQCYSVRIESSNNQPMQEAILMYCPRCGKENPEKQRFCNSCGLKLESISNVITDEAAESRDDRFIEGFRGGYKGWQAPLIYAFVVIAAGMLIGFIGYKILSVKTLGDIGTLVSLVGVVVLLLKGISLLMPSDTASARK